MKSSLGQRIAYYRKKLGFAQKDLAMAVGISPTIISRYESDKREPNITMLISIAKVLNTTSDILLGLEPTPGMIAQNLDEYTLLRNFRTLNNLGQGKLLDYSSDLGGLPKYAGGPGRT